MYLKHFLKTIATYQIWPQGVEINLDQALSLIIVGFNQELQILHEINIKINKNESLER